MNWPFQPTEVQEAVPYRDTQRLIGAAFTLCDLSNEDWWDLPETNEEDKELATYWLRKSFLNVLEWAAQADIQPDERDIDQADYQTVDVEDLLLEWRCEGRDADGAYAFVLTVLSGNADDTVLWFDGIIDPLYIARARHACERRRIKLRTRK